MYKLLLTVALTALFMADRAQASVGRIQDSHIGALNRVVWAGGIGSARGDNQGSFTQTQEVQHHSGLLARQTERGSLTQTATVGGTGPGTARQAADVKGAQDLLAGTAHGFHLRGQQELGVKLDMRLSQPNGVGTVNGAQNYTGAQEQTLTTPASASSQSQSVDARQSGSIATGTNIDPTVRNRINIDLHQIQTANGR